ncbi:hypothetical protein [Dyadobacter sp. CY323]|uniref:hypothetical protein n=1 Tax=Dyadobacter sp. CY323 TaxID=2907302 RepID=UPI001F37BD8D|nr:hypothetical protein [Dyadobacter sp. CY323]MCE6991421.1 hypothetical protein [Dyadobacter sp. CY323]
MDAIKIRVNKQMDGYSFSISPSIRDFIRKLFPNAHPANNQFVDTQTGNVLHKVTPRDEKV